MTPPSDPAPQDLHRPAPLHGRNDYPLIDIPFTVVIEGRRYAGAGLSMVGAEVTGLVDKALDGKEGIARLIFDFPGYELVLTPSTRIAVADDNRLLLHFTEPTGEHAPQLRQVLGDYISGDLTSSGAIIRAGAFAETSKGKAAAPRPSFGRRLRSGLGTLAVLGATAALVAIGVGLAQSRLFTTAIPAPGRVVPQGQTMRATADGQITYLDTSATKGDVLFSLDSVDGETLSIAMPCDCTVRSTGVTEGSTVLAGEPVLALSEPDAPMLIEAQLPQELLFDIQRAGHVSVELPDGRDFRATLTEDFRPPGIEAAEMPVRALLRPETELPEDALGQVAALTVPLAPTASFDPVIDAAGDLQTGAANIWNNRIRPIYADLTQQSGAQE